MSEELKNLCLTCKNFWEFSKTIKLVNDSANTVDERVKTRMAVKCTVGDNFLDRYGEERQDGEQIFKGITACNRHEPK